MIDFVMMSISHVDRHLHEILVGHTFCLQDNAKPLYLPPILIPSTLLRILVCVTIDLAAVQI
jgi:hypothetical protein